MRPALFTLVVAIALGSSALAAEPADWSGWYGAAFGGYIDAKPTAADHSHLESLMNLDDNSPIFGIQLGVLRQSEKGFVYGGELVVPLYMQKATAQDSEDFTDRNPGVIYEGIHKWSVLVGGRAGRAMGRWLPSIFAAVGFAHGEGRTLNVDGDYNYSPGFVQSATATHLVFQLGGGADCQVTDKIFLGARILVFDSDQQKYEMDWNRGENDNFGMHSTVFQAHVGRRF
jgi:opacity protein-like surface antigen